MYIFRIEDVIGCSRSKDVNVANCLYIIAYVLIVTSEVNFRNFPFLKMLQGKN